MLDAAKVGEYEKTDFVDKGCPEASVILPLPWYHISCGRQFCDKTEPRTSICIISFCVIQ